MARSWISFLGASWTGTFFFLLSGEQMVTRCFLAVLLSLVQLDTSVIEVLCIGDSLTEGNQNYEPKAQWQNSLAGRSTSYPAQLQALLGSGYRVTNLGAAGSTATDWAITPSKVKGTGNYSKYNDLMAGSWDIAIVMLGTNDSKHPPSVGVGRWFWMMFFGLWFIAISPVIAWCYKKTASLRQMEGGSEGMEGGSEGTDLADSESEYHQTESSCTGISAATSPNGVHCSLDGPKLNSMAELQLKPESELETSEQELDTLDPPGAEPDAEGPIESGNVLLRDKSKFSSGGLPQHRTSIKRCVAVTAVLSAAYWCLAIVLWSNGFEGYAHEDSLSPVTLCEADNLGMACNYVNDYSAILQVPSFEFAFFFASAPAFFFFFSLLF